MAERRMFAKTIIDSDAFVDMPMSARCLYYDLSMRADDDGFVNNPKKVQRSIGASEDDLKLLMAKNFIIPFESGVIVIKHWRIHNYIRNDRYKQTVYQEEMELLDLKDNGSYTLKTNKNNLGIPDDNQMETQYRLGKVSIGKDNKDILGKTFVKPTIKEIEDYCLERKNKINAEEFYDFYETSNWFRGKTKIKDWKGCIRTWERNNNTKINNYSKLQKNEPIPDYKVESKPLTKEEMSSLQERLKKLSK